ncbi:MAG: ATP-binding protein [Gemmatimonadota bacterium]|nr:ATP-binding protein [Gemmatimonadota bacterium]
MAAHPEPPNPDLFEKLGAFYLGRGYDLDAEGITSDLLLYDAKDLTTHAVCVGMTGSGKTGLCLSLLEEAAIDGIPAIAIDPKGDLGNLLLTFPDLAPSDFRPWIDEAEAGRKGVTPDAYATEVAQSWRAGLASWGQTGDRIARLRAAADVAVYTPGSNAGWPLTVLQSFAAPASAVRDDADALRERVSSSASGLLALLGIEADPVRSREHVLLSTILQEAWGRGQDLDLAGLIGSVQSPGVEKIGVMALETFFPQADRMELALRLNSLLASPGFAAWLEGEPLDIPKMLWTADGRPRIAILSIAHLSEPERMFFVTLLLNEMVSWMRGQSGTTSLRALLYMDEVFGYFPPTANPPSKTPMLTLLKQARAYGIGVVLATQNPVDLDYKGLANTGTWFLGRLQTERDKLRVLEGLEGASAAAGAGFDRARMDKVLAGLKSRVFLMHNVHDDGPVLFHTRWALSYLRGPLTRTQIQTLMANRPRPGAAELAPAKASPAPGPQAAPAAASSRPIVPPEAGEGFIAPARTIEGSRLLYRPALLGRGDLHFVSAKDKVDEWETVTYVAPLTADAGIDAWDAAERLGGPVETSKAQAAAADFAELPARAVNGKSYQSWERSFKTYLYQSATLTVLQSPELKVSGRPGETRAEFTVRLREEARQRRDAVVEKLRRQYAPKLRSLQERIRKAEERIGREKTEYGQQKMQSAISVGATVLGALLGRKVTSVGNIGRATTAARGFGRAARQKDDVARAQRDLEALHEQFAQLEARFQTDATAAQDGLDIEALGLEECVIRPRKSDISVSRVALAWLPWWVDQHGVATPAYR